MKVLSLWLIDKLSGKARSIEEIADKAGVHRNSLGSFLRLRRIGLRPRGYELYCIDTNKKIKVKEVK